MSAELIPPRASDAGPDTSEPEHDWYELLLLAEDEIRYAQRQRRDNPKIERKLRESSIKEAIEHLQAALEKLP